MNSVFARCVQNWGFQNNMFHYFEDRARSILEGDPQGIFFCVSIYTFVLLMISFIYQLRILRWPKVIGQLHGLDITEWGVKERQRSNQMYEATSSYSYSVNGVEYESNRVSPWYVLASRNARFLLEAQLNSITGISDGRVGIYYDPKNPKKSYLIKPGRFGILTTLVISVAPIILYVLKYHT